MWWKYIVAQVAIIAIVFFLCKTIVQLIGSWFTARNYKIKKEFYFILMLVNTMTIGVFFGGEILYKIL
jgi:NADH:ubiquinone oxidoreductase subunit 4 (subunit M)